MKAMEYSGTILFVDDEFLILKSLQRELLEEPFDTKFANSGEEALEIMGNEDIAVLVTDLRMPEMNGMELLEIVKKKYPDIIRLVLTAYTQKSTILAALNNRNIYYYLTKPFKVESEVIPVLRNALQLYSKNQAQKSLLKELESQNTILQQQNYQLEDLRSKAEKNSEVKEKIINYLSKKITPYVADVIYTVMQVEDTDNKSIQKLSKDIRTNGKDILDLLKQIESILSSNIKSH
ncbi:MAG: response regulator [Candidatus Zixiibacteriota bacterium]